MTVKEAPSNSNVVDVFTTPLVPYDDLIFKLHDNSIVVESDKYGSLWHLGAATFAGCSGSNSRGRAASEAAELRKHTVNDSKCIALLWGSIPLSGLALTGKEAQPLQAVFVVFFFDSYIRVWLSINTNYWSYSGPDLPHYQLILKCLNCCLFYMQQLKTQPFWL